MLWIKLWNGSDLKKSIFLRLRKNAKVNHPKCSTLLYSLFIICCLFSVLRRSYDFKPQKWQRKKVIVLLFSDKTDNKNRRLRCAPPIIIIAQTAPFAFVTKAAHHILFGRRKSKNGITNDDDNDDNELKLWFADDARHTCGSGFFIFWFDLSLSLSLFSINACSNVRKKT